MDAGAVTPPDPGPGRHVWHQYVVRARRRDDLRTYLGEHGVAVMSKREGLEFGTEIRSDTAPLHGLVAAMLDVTRAAIISPTSTGPSSRTMPMATICGTTASAEKRAPPA